MRRKDTTGEPGIWVRIELDTGAMITGFAPGAESPNDFWTVFKTQLVRLDEVREIPRGGTRRDFPTLYVNRDRIVVVDVESEEDDEDGGAERS
jgi:hypothetical protein